MTIREARKQLNMTQLQLAKIIHLDVSVISKYENGIMKPTPKRIKELAAALKISPEEITFDVNPSPDIKVDYALMDFDKPIILENNKTSEKKVHLIYYNLIHRLIVASAEGKCELCNCEAPCNDDQGYPLLHHFVLDYNFDGPFEKNIVALCSNCRDKLKYTKKSDDIEILKEKASKHCY